MRSRRPARAVLTLVGVAVLLAGCSDSTPAATSVGKPKGSTSASQGSSRFPTYVALGDSFTAAPGVPTTEQDDGCLRSDGNYPSLLAERLGDPAFVDVSCSAASTASLVGVQQNSGHTSEPQFDSLHRATSLVTMGIGANDLDFYATVITGCIQQAATDVTGAPCQAYAEAHGKNGGDLLLQKVRQLAELVQAALEGVHDRSPQAMVVLVGYPQPVPATGTCRSILPFATGDYPYVRHVFAVLDAALGKAATAADATYIDVAKASAGHDICAGDQAWVNGINTDVDRALAFHPFAAEQQAVAGLIAQALGVS